MLIKSGTYGAFHDGNLYIFPILSKFKFPGLTNGSTAKWIWALFDFLNDLVVSEF